jgi:hypothetical protein
MEAVSDLLSANWITIPSGYLVRMKMSDVVQRKEWWELFDSQREAALAAQREAMLNAMRSTPRPPDPNDPNPERGVAEGYRNAMDMASVYKALSSDLQERIASQISDYGLYTGFFAGNMTEGGIAAPVASLPAAVQASIASDAERLLAAANVPAGETSALFLNFGTNIFLSVMTPGGDLIPTRFTFNGTRPTTEATVLDLDQRWLPKEVERLGSGAPLLTSSNIERAILNMKCCVNQISTCVSRPSALPCHR